MKKLQTQDARSSSQWILLATILASGMAILDGTALNVALPTLQKELQASGVQLLWIVNAYMLMLAAFILPGGSLGDHLGRKKIFSIGIALFLVASLACGLASTTKFLIAARVVQGLGGALMIPGSLAIITAFFDTDERGRAIGTWSGAGAAVVVLGPLLGGVLADAGLWRWVFFINLPIGLLTLYLVYTKVPESIDEEAPKQIDYIGALLVSLGLAALTYGFTSLPSYGLYDPRVYGSLLGGTVALMVFGWVESTGSHPMMPLSLFQSKTFSGANLLTLFLYGALNVSTFFLSLNLVQLQGYSPSLAGLAFMPLPIPLVLFSRWVGGIADRWGTRLPLMIGPFLAGCGFLFLSFVGITSGPKAYWYTFFPGILVFGIGMTITVVPLTNAVMGSVARHYAGTASGINNAVSRLAAVLALAIIGALALSTFTSQAQQYMTALPLTAAERVAFLAEAEKFGEARAEAVVSNTRGEEVQKIFDQSFAATFALIMRICTVLAWLSAGMAALLVEKKSEPAIRRT